MSIDARVSMGAEEIYLSSFERAVREASRAP